MVRIILWSATALALALLLWLMNRPPPPLPASVTMLPPAASPLLEGPEPDLEDLRTLLHHGDPVVAGRAFERLHAMGRSDVLDGKDLTRAAHLAVNGAEYARRSALLILLDVGYLDWFPRVADFLDTRTGPITRDLMLHVLVKRGEGHRAKLEAWAAAEKDDATSRLAREVAFWLERNQVPALPPGYADGEATGPRSTEARLSPSVRGP